MRSESSKNLDTMISSAIEKNTPNPVEETILDPNVDTRVEAEEDESIVVAGGTKQEILKAVTESKAFKTFADKNKNSNEKANQSLDEQATREMPDFEKEVLEEGQVGGEYIIKQADEGFGDKVLYNTEKAPVITKPKKWGETEYAPGAFNTLRIDGPDAFKQHFNTVSEAYGADAVEITSYKDIAEQFKRTYSVQAGKTEATKNKFAVFDDKTGKKLTDYFDNIDDAKIKQIEVNNKNNYDEKFLAYILDKSQKTIADPKETFRMMVVLNDASQNTFHYANKIQTLRRNGDEVSQELRTRFLNALALEGNIMKAVKGRQADVARSLGVLSMKRVATKDRALHFENIIDNAGGSDSVNKMADRYLALGTKGDRSKLAQSSTFGKLKDMWWSGYVNNLLYGPYTHLKNMAGNTLFHLWQVPEYFTASAIGKGRKILFPKTEDAIKFRSVFAMQKGFVNNIAYSWKLMKQVFKENKPIDPKTKLEMDRPGRDSFDINLLEGMGKFADSDFAKSQQALFKFYGHAATLPGRALMAEDEFFKAMNKLQLLNFHASDQSLKLYDAIKGTKNLDDLKPFLNDEQIKSLKLVDGRLSDEDAKKIAAKFEADIFNNPQDYPEILEDINEYARVNTFTNDLEGAWLALSKGLNVGQKYGIAPLRAFAVFVRTPANITSQVLQRTPLNIKGYQNILKGGREADKALARMALGSGSLYYFMDQGFSGRITGYGPPNYQDRELLKSQGWRPFSIVFNRDEFRPSYVKMYTKLLGKDAIHVAHDKVYVSYKGLEPLSALLGIAASTAEYFTLNPKAKIDDDDMNIFQAATMAFTEYFGEQTYLTGIGDFMDMFTVNGTEPAALHLYNMFSGISKKTAEVVRGGTPVLGLMENAAFRHIERILAGGEIPVIDKAVKTDPAGYYKNPLEGMVAAWAEVADRAYYKTPHRRLVKTKGELAAEKKELDPISGKKIKIGNGSWIAAFNPFDNSKGKVDKSRVIMFALGLGEYEPKQFYTKVIDGVTVNVRFTGEEMYEIIKEATKDQKIHFKIINHYETNGLEDRIAAFNKNRNINNFNLAKEQSAIQDIINTEYKKAQETIINNSRFSASLQERLSANYERLRKHGKRVK